MAWLQLDNTFGEKPEFIRFRRTLGVSKFEARGIIITLYTWTHRNNPDGKLGDLTIEEFAETVGWDGDTDKLETALRGNFIDDDNGIIGWGEMVGSYKVAERRRKQRENKKTAMSHDSRTTVATMSHDSRTTVPSEKRREERIREDKIREDIILGDDFSSPSPPAEKKKPKSPKDLALESDNEELLAYHSEIHPSLGPYKRNSHAWSSGLARLREGMTLEEGKAFIRCNANDPFYQEIGKHEFGFIFQKKRIDEWRSKIARKTTGPPRTTSKANQRIQNNLTESLAWLDKEKDKEHDRTNTAKIFGNHEHVGGGVRQRANGG